MGLSLGLLILSSAATLYQRRKAKKARAEAQRRAEAAAREAAAIEARPSNTNQIVPIIYGYAGVGGLKSYTQVSKNWVAAGSNATDTQIPGTANFLKSDLEKNQVLGFQDVLSVGDLSAVTFALVDGDPASSSQFNNSIDLRWQLGYRDGVAYSPHAAISVIGFYERNYDTDKFVGLTYVNGGMFLDLDDPQYAGVPDMFYYCVGIPVNRVVNGVSVAGLAAMRNNAALVLLDYITGENHYGGNIPPARIDFASFESSSEICQRAFSHNGSQNALSYPAYRNQIAATAYATYADYIASETSITATLSDGLEIPERMARHGVADNAGQLLRYEFNGVISTATSYIDAIEQIKTSMPGCSYFRSLNGKWTLRIPDPRVDPSGAPVVEEFVEGAEFVINYPDADTLINRITARYSDIENDYAGGILEFPKPGTPFDQQLQQADGAVFRDTVDLVGVKNRLHAISICVTMILLSHREVFTFTCARDQMRYEPGDDIRLKNPQLNVDVYARIKAKRPNPDLTFTFNAIRYSRWDYDLYLTDCCPIPLVAESPA